MTIDLVIDKCKRCNRLKIGCEYQEVPDNLKKDFYDEFFKYVEVYCPRCQNETEYINFKLK